MSRLFDEGNPTDSSDILTHKITYGALMQEKLNAVFTFQP